jgi:hypothetical protein
MKEHHEKNSQIFVARIVHITTPRGAMYHIIISLLWRHLDPDSKKALRLCCQDWRAAADELVNRRVGNFLLDSEA